MIMIWVFWLQQINSRINQREEYPMSLINTAVKPFNATAYKMANSLKYLKKICSVSRVLLSCRLHFCLPDRIG